MTVAYETTPLVKPTGFREYDARWLLGPELNLLGVQALGLGLGTYFHELGQRRIVVGHDFRSYSLSIKQALTLGLVSAGCEVLDIGLALTPMAYFAQFDLERAVRGHGHRQPQRERLDRREDGRRAAADLRPGRDRPAEGDRADRRVAQKRPAARSTQVEGVAERYIADAAARCRLTRPIRVVCACGNGTAGAFAPEALRRMGAEVIEMDCELDWTFPNYNPNPEDTRCSHAMTRAVREHGADLALGFDGDGDRCGVVDDAGEEIFADKIGLMLARDLAPDHPGAKFVVDVKSTGLFATDPVLKARGRVDRLLEDRPQLHQAQDRRDRRAGRVREVRPLLLQPAARARLRRRPDRRRGDPLDARPPSRQEAQRAEARCRSPTPR